MGCCILCSTSKHVETYRWRNFHGKRISHHDLDQEETKHSQFTLIKKNWSPQPRTVVMRDKVLYGILRIPIHGKHYLLRQQELHYPG